jgi:triosephosphate isomerase
MAPERKFFVGGNWKMNGNKKEIDAIISFLTAGPLDPNAGNIGKFNCSVNIS